MNPYTLFVLVLFVLLAAAGTAGAIWYGLTKNHEADRPEDKR